MSSLRDLLNDLVRTGKSTAPREQPRAPEPPAEKKLAPKHDRLPKPVVTAPVEYKPAPPRKTERLPLDPDCAHKWAWRAGVKQCWLCGGHAPVDQRDRSTSWQSRVYGGRK